MRSIAFVLLISSISAVFAQPSAKWTVLGKEYAVDTLKHCQVGPGTTLTILDLTGADRQRVFFTTTDLANPIVQIKTICGNNNLKTNLTIPQMIENNGDKANEYFAGVNADLFSANGPIGTTVVDSEIFKTARSTTDWYSVGADAGKNLHFGQFYTTFRLTSTTTGQMSVKSVITGLPQSNAGNMSIPSGGIVLSANASWYMEPLQKLQIGDIVEITPTFTLNGKVVDQITEMSGGCPMILQDGKILDTDKLLDHLSYRRPRTAIGTDQSGSKMILMVVDGDKFNAGISDGVTSKELAGMMIMAGCNDALNFDGGGSSTIYSEALGTLNRPSDGNLRKVRNGWFLTAPKTTDGNIASIAFADYSKKLNVNDSFRPVVYGYNGDGYLVNADIAGYRLSCTPGNGVEISDNTVSFKATGNYRLEAAFGSEKALMTVVVGDNAGASAIKEGALSIRSIGSDVEITMPYDSDVRIFNSLGVCLATEKCDVGTTILPTSGLTPGLYLIATEREIKKILIK